MEKSRNIIMILIIGLIILPYLNHGQWVTRQRYDLIYNPRMEDCSALNAMAYYRTKCSCRTSRNESPLTIGLYNTENNTLWCYSLKTLGCSSITLINPLIESTNEYNISYDASVTHIKPLFVGFETFTYNIDANNQSRWERVEENITKLFFNIDSNKLMVKDLKNIWNGHAIKFNLRFTNASEQCLFVKVGGDITYPKTVRYTLPSSIGIAPLMSSQLLSPSFYIPKSTPVHLQPNTYYSSMASFSAVVSFGQMDESVSSSSLSTADVYTKSTLSKMGPLQTTAKLETQSIERSSTMKPLPPLTTATSITSTTKLATTTTTLATTATTTTTPAPATSSAIITTTNETETVRPTVSMLIIIGTTSSVLCLIVLLVLAFLIVRRRMLKKRQVLPNEIVLAENDNASTSSASGSTLHVTETKDKMSRPEGENIDTTFYIQK